jgi:hypothetical protein
MDDICKNILSLYKKFVKNHPVIRSNLHYNFSRGISSVDVNVPIRKRCSGRRGLITRRRVREGGRGSVLREEREGERERE